MELYSEIVEDALAKLNAHLTNPNAFSQQENDEVQVELASATNDLLDPENDKDSDMLFEDSSPLPSYITLILMSDNELNSKFVQNKSRADPIEREPLHIFLRGDAGSRKSFLMRVI